MKKRILSVLLALTMLLGLTPVTARAAGPVSGDGWELAANGTLTISSDLGTSSWDSHPNGSLVNANNVTSVVITDAVTSIGELVFMNHSNLTSVTIGNSVETIEYGAFNGCTSLTSVTMRGDTPPTLDDSWGDDDVFKNCGFVQSNTKGIVVPSGSVQAYKDKWVQWKDYIAGDEPSAHSHPVCGAACDGHTGSHGNVTWTEFPTGTTALTAGSYYLTGDISGSTPITISGEVNLCLNGHSITNSTGHGISVTSGATLNLCDCGSGGTVTGSYGIYNSSSSSVTVNGGAVTGGYYGIGTSGTVTVNGGDITGNTYQGINSSGGTITVNGGIITSNNNNGINGYGSVTLTVTGGTITGKSGYGINYDSKGTFTLGGSPAISGNTADIYLGKDKTVTVDSGGLTGGPYSVAIPSSVTPTETTPVAITAAASADYSGHFTSADGYDVHNDGTGSNQVVQLYVPHSHSWANDWQSSTTHHWHNCTATGCTVTENSEKDGYAEHTPVAIGTAVAATCNTAGTTAGSKCDLCGYIITPQETIPATGAHTSVTDAAVAATCTTAGKTEGSHCSVCNAIIVAQTEIPTISHNYGAWTITAEPTLTTEGAATQVCENDSTHKNTVTLPVLTDTTVWAEGTRVEPTEDTDGSQEYNSEYGTVTVTIPALDHTHEWGAWTIKTAPTTEATGTAERVCTANSDHKETFTLPVLTDTSVWNAGAKVEPTEDADGLQEYTSVYGIVTVTIPKLEPATPPADPTYDVSGTVKEDAENRPDEPVNGATVKLMRGNQQIGTDVITDGDGNYQFTGVAPGWYNVVVTKDDQIKTISVEIKDGNVTVPAIKMDGTKHSVVEVKGQDTPAVVVGGVDEIAEAESVSPGDTVTVKLTVEAKSESAAVGASAIKQTASGKTLEYIDLTLTKQINNETATNIGDSNTRLLTIVIPFAKGDKENITVYRYHGDKAETLPTAANSDGEYFTVGDAAITVYAKKFSTYAIGYTTAVTTYTLTVNGGAGSGSYAAGTVVSISATIPSGKRFTGWTGATVANAGSASTTLTMPARNTTVTANFADSTPTPTPQPSYGGGSYSPATYPANVPDSVPNGTVSVSPKSAGRGITVTITVTPDEGYEIGRVTVTDKDGNVIAVTDQGDGKYTFTMPAGKVTVSASFTKIRGGYAGCPKDYTCPIWPYTDASVTAWYHDGVHYCIENGLMSGYGNYTFGPNGDTNRAMIATILWRLEGSPVVNYILPFDDVAEGVWYAEAIRWAAASGVAGGYGNGKFGPGDPITREQLAAMLYRYEQYKGGGFTGAWMFPLNYTDAELVSSWAYEPMCWTTMNGIMEGVGNGLLDPAGKATRAQAAAMMMRFCEKD